MATINKKLIPIRTHEGAIAPIINAEAQLRRSVMACLLWEDEFYEGGESITDRIFALVKEIPDQIVANIAIEARSKQNLRHVPLWIAVCLARKRSGVLKELLPQIIQRADELTEFLALYWKDGKTPIANSVKKGLAQAFGKFNEYQLAKYNRQNSIKLRDVLFLSHAKPKDAEQDTLWKRLINGELAIPDTWEVALSSGADKRETWIRLITEKKLGALALLRNLRNMAESNVPDNIIRQGLSEMNADRILPFRFISAAKYAPGLEDALESAMFRNLAEMPKLSGKTVIIVDNSGSMYGTAVSAKSEIDRSDAACALAVLVREICQIGVIISFADQPCVIPPRRGFGLIAAIKGSPRGSTNTRLALDLGFSQNPDRIIVITDEQSHQSIRQLPAGVKGYFINVASTKNGIGYGSWIHIDGWSESVINYIQAHEASE